MTGIKLLEVKDFAIQASVRTMPEFYFVEFQLFGAYLHGHEGKYVRF